MMIIKTYILRCELWNFEPLIRIYSLNFLMDFFYNK